MYKVKGSMTVLLLTATLSACSGNQADQSSDDKSNSTQQEKPIDKTVESENKAATDSTETMGYIASIASDEIFIVPTLDQVNNPKLREKEIKGQIFILTRDMEEEKISNLKVGQKVKVLHSKDIMYSSPPQAYGDDIEVLK